GWPNSASQSDPPTRVLMSFRNALRSALLEATQRTGFRTQSADVFGGILIVCHYRHIGKMRVTRAAQMPTPCLRLRETHGESSMVSRHVLRMRRAWGESGTRCANPFLLRSAGIYPTRWNAGKRRSAGSTMNGRVEFREVAGGQRVRLAPRGLPKLESVVFDRLTRIPRAGSRSEEHTSELQSR